MDLQYQDSFHLCWAGTSSPLLSFVLEFLRSGCLHTQPQTGDPARDCQLSSHIYVLYQHPEPYTEQEFCHIIAEDRSYVTLMSYLPCFWFFKTIQLILTCYDHSVLVILYSVNKSMTNCYEGSDRNICECCTMYKLWAHLIDFAKAFDVPRKECWVKLFPLLTSMLVVSICTYVIILMTISVWINNTLWLVYIAASGCHAKGSSLWSDKRDEDVLEHRMLEKSLPLLKNELFFII